MLTIYAVSINVAMTESLQNIRNIRVQIFLKYIQNNYVLPFFYSPFPPLQQDNKLGVTETAIGFERLHIVLKLISF